MKAIAIAAAALLIAANASTAAKAAGADPAKCIIEAAARLPAAPGMTITESKHRELTAKEAVGWKDHPYGPPLVVEVSARAAERDASYVFLCTSAGVRPLPDGKVPQ